MVDDYLDESEAIHYKNKKKFVNHLEELTIYVENNRHLIPNYGERWRYGETIASSFVESTVNEVQLAELARLKRENSRLEQENAFLKKAAAYFAKVQE